MRKTLGMGAALLALAIGAALLNRAKPGSQAPPSAASQGRPLRLNRLPVEAKPTPLPSTIAGRTKPATPTAPLQSLPSRAISAPALGSPSRPSTSANFEIGRDEVLKERDGVFGYNSRFYGATFDAGAVEIATGLILKDIGRPRFSYALEEVRVGGKSICSGGTIGAQADPETRTLSYARGSVEERYILSKESLEQTFVLRELPAGRGEITVTGRVATNLTPPRDGTSGGTLSFLYRDQELLSVAKAVAIDASGRRLPLELAYSGGRMSMSVPAEWVADAALPILVDPVIGGPVVVDNKLAGFVDTVNGQFVRICDAAYSGASGQWLAIWAEPFGASAFNYDLFGQRVDASGARVGKPLPIGTSTGGDYESSIAASSAGNFLVAWRHDPANDASVADQIILGRIVNADGTFAGGAFTLDDLPGQDFGPSLAFGGGQWLCAFTNIPSAGNSDIRGRLVSEAGVPGSAVELDLEADLAARPSLDFASTSFVVAWEKGPAGGPYSAVARAVDVAGALTTPITEIDGGTNDATFVDVSAGGGKVLIAWQERIAPSNLNVVGRIAEPSLAFATPPITLNAGLTEQVTPRAAYSELNSEWLVVYSDPITAGQDVYANRISIAGSAFPAEKVSTGGQADRRPELAWNSASNEMLIVYLFKTSDPYQVRAGRFSMDYAAPAIPGTPVGAPNPNPTGTHTVSWTPSTDGGGSGLAGYDLQRSSDGGSAYAIIASPTGTSFTELGLPLGSYLYRVRARDNAGNASAYSPPSDPVVVGGSAPVAPSNLAGSPQSHNSIQWTWVDASSDETGFRLKDENGATRVDSIPGDATNILEAGLAPNTAYARRAFAFSASGESAGSNLATVSTLLATPTQADFAVTATRWDQIQISVLPPPNSTDLQTGVRIERSLDGAAWALVQDFAPVYSALDSGRFQNTTHFYRITFQNRVGVPTASSLANSVSTPGMPAPVISSPAEGVVLSTQTPTVSGTSAIAGLTITLFVEGVPRGSTTSGTGGSWSLPPSSPLLDGQRSFTARASDALGNASAHSAAVLVTIDTNPPLITSATPANGSTTGSLRPTISAAWSDAVSGVVPATAQTLLDGANITGQCTVSPTGFTHVPAVDLSQGAHTVAAQIADAAGNLGFIQWTFTVLPPDATGPLLTLSPGQGEKIVDNTPSFTATYSDAGSGIDITQFRAFIDNVDVTASFSAGASQATFTAAAPFADGIHLFRAFIKDLAGNLTELTNLFRVVSALAEVGTGGGSLAVTDPTRAAFGARIEVPSGALSQPVTLWMEHVAAASPLPPGFIRVGPVVDFMPEMSFLQPITVSLPYDEGAAAALGVPEADLKLLRYDLTSNQWVLLPVSAVQAAANLLQASLNSFAGIQIVAVAETSAQAYFVVEGPTGSIQAGAPVSITIRAFHPNGAIFDTFAGNVEVALTGGRGPAGNAVFPESIPATFTAANQGVLTLTDALTFALFGIQTVRVTADANPSMVGQTQVGVTSGPPAEFVKFAGDGQDALAGTVLAQSLVTRVRDAYGNPTPGAQVSYLITSSGASFEDRPDNIVPGTPLPNPSTVTVDSLGYAISPYLRLPGSSTTTLVSATLLGSTIPSQDFLLLSSANQLDPPVITSPSSGSVVNTPTPVIRGTIAIIDPEFPGAVPGYYVYLVVDGMPAGQAIIQTDLSWNILCNSLPNGTHNFFAYTYDSVSSRSSPGVSFSITVAGTDRPAITTPSQFVQTPTPLIEGTALPNTPVTVSFNGAVDGATRSNGSGDWSYLASTKAPGVYSVIARATDSTGSLVDSNSVSIIYQANVAPQITTQSFTTNDTTPTIQGTALPNVQVMISLSLPFHEGSAFSDASGNWSYTFSELAIGTLFDGSPGSSYEVVAQMLLAGNQLSGLSNTITMTILGPDTTQPVISQPLPEPGTHVHDTTPEISVLWSDTGSGLALSSARLLLDGVDVTVSAALLPEGLLFQTSTPLVDGGHQVEVRIEDLAGNIRVLQWAFEVEEHATSSLLSLESTTLTSTRLSSLQGNLAVTTVVAINLDELSTGGNPPPSVLDLTVTVEIRDSSGVVVATVTTTVPVLIPEGMTGWISFPVTIPWAGGSLGAGSYDFSTSASLAGSGITAQSETLSGSSFYQDTVAPMLSLGVLIPHKPAPENQDPPYYDPPTPFLFDPDAVPDKEVHARGDDGEAPTRIAAGDIAALGLTPPVIPPEVEETDGLDSFAAAKVYTSYRYPSILGTVSDSPSTSVVRFYLNGIEITHTIERSEGNFLCDLYSRGIPLAEGTHFFSHETLDSASNSVQHDLEIVVDHRRPSLELVAPAPTSLTRHDKDEDVDVRVEFSFSDLGAKILPESFKVSIFGQDMLSRFTVGPTGATADISFQELLDLALRSRLDFNARVKDKAGIEKRIDASFHLTEVPASLLSMINQRRLALNGLGTGVSLADERNVGTLAEAADEAAGTSAFFADPLRMDGIPFGAFYVYPEDFAIPPRPHTDFLNLPRSDFIAKPREEKITRLTDALKKVSWVPGSITRTIMQKTGVKHLASDPPTIAQSSDLADIASLTAANDPWTFGAPGNPRGDTQFSFFTGSVGVVNRQGGLPFAIPDVAGCIPGSVHTVLERSLYNVDLSKFKSLLSVKRIGKHRFQVGGSFDFINLAEPPPRRQQTVQLRAMAGSMPSPFSSPAAGQGAWIQAGEGGFSVQGTVTYHYHRLPSDPEREIPPAPASGSQVIVYQDIRGLNVVEFEASQGTTILGTGPLDQLPNSFLIGMKGDESSIDFPAFFSPFDVPNNPCKSSASVSGAGAGTIRTHFVELIFDDAPVDFIIPNVPHYVPAHIEKASVIASFQLRNAETGEPSGSLPDGSVVEFTISSGPDGPQSTPERVLTEEGFAMWDLDLARKTGTEAGKRIAGDQFRVLAKLVEVSGQRLLSPRVLATAPIVVVCGYPVMATVSHIDADILCADGLSTTEVRIVARDTQGNVVDSPEEPVHWRVDGDSVLLGADRVFRPSGDARAFLQAGTMTFPDKLIVSGGHSEAEGFRLERTIVLRKPTIRFLQPLPTSLTVCEGQEALLNVEVTCPEAPKGVAPGVKVVWFASKGSIDVPGARAASHVGFLRDGRSQAVLRTSEVTPYSGRRIAGVERTGNSQVTVNVGGTALRHAVAFNRTSADLAVTTHSVIIGDEIQPGNFTLDLAEGRTQSVPYQTTALIVVTGSPPGRPVHVDLVGSSTASASYGMDDDAGGQMRDRAFGNHGTAASVVVDFAKKARGAASYRFDAAASVRVPDGALLRPSNNLEFEVMLATEGQAAATILAKGSEYGLGLDAAGHVGMFVRTETGTHLLWSPGVVNDGLFHQITARFHSGVLSISVDGHGVSRTLPAAAGNLTLAQSTGDLVLGGFVGHLDELEVRDTRNGLLEFVGGNSGFLDASGTATFTVRSTGLLASEPNILGRLVMVQVTNPTSGELVDCHTTGTLKVAKKDLAQRINSVARGIVAGMDDQTFSFEELAGDMVASFFLWGDVRDFTLYTWAGIFNSDELGTMDHVVGILSGLGIISTLIPQADVFVLTAKAIAKLAKAGFRFAKHMVHVIRKMLPFILQRQFQQLDEWRVVFARLVEMFTNNERAAFEFLEESVGNDAEAMDLLAKAAAVLGAGGRKFDEELKLIEDFVAQLVRAELPASGKTLLAQLAPIVPLAPDGMWDFQVPSLLSAAPALRAPGKVAASLVKIAGRNADVLTGLSPIAQRVLATIVAKVGNPPTGQVLCESLLKLMREHGIVGEVANKFFSHLDVVAKLPPQAIEGQAQRTFDRWLLGLAAIKRSGAAVADQEKTFFGALWELKALADTPEIVMGQVTDAARRLGPDALKQLAEGGFNAVEAKFRSSPESLLQGIGEIAAQVANNSRRFATDPNNTLGFFLKKQELIINVLPKDENQINAMMQVLQLAMKERGDTGITHLIVKMYDLEAKTAAELLGKNLDEVRVETYLVTAEDWIPQ